MTRRGAWLLLALPLAGCAYYNGMYNANRFAHRAQKAQAEGRTFEAQGYWAQAELRADTVIARHPESRYVDDAQLIRGEAMVVRGDCTGAIPALEVASLSRDSPKVAERANQLLGECRMAAGDLARADIAWVELLSSPDTALRAEAQLQHARVQRSLGDYAGALATLGSQSGAPADMERAAAYAGLGDVAHAQPLLDSALARQDPTAPWDSILAGLGRVDLAVASGYAGRVVRIPGLPPEARDQILLADGLRLLRVVPDSGLARLRQAADASPVTKAALQARLVLAEFTLSLADSLPDLEAAREALQSLGEVGGPSAMQALRYLQVLDRARGYRDSVPPGSPNGDLATFVVGEAVRDGLPTPRVARQLFAAVPAGWPASPYAPKALLALAAMEPDSAEALVQRIQAEYPESPYLLLAEGTVTPAVLALEDSLLLYAAGGARPAAPGRRAPAGNRPPAGQRTEDELK